MEGVNYDQKVSLAVEAHVLGSVDQLSHSSGLIEDLANSGKIKMIGAMLDLHSSAVRFID